MLEPRLVGKRLDVCIKGSTFYNGRYEGKGGFIILTSTPFDWDTSIEVRIGYEQSKRNFRACHLWPEKTMEIPQPAYLEKGLTEPTRAAEVIMMTGVKVIIIGADLRDDEAWIGYFGVTRTSPLPGSACVILLQTWPPTWTVDSPSAFFPPDSICHSQ